MKPAKRDRVSLVLAVLAWLAERKHLRIYHIARGMRHDTGDHGTALDYMSFTAADQTEWMLPGGEAFLPLLLEDNLDVTYEACVREDIDELPEVADDDSVKVVGVNPGLWFVTRTTAGEDGDPDVVELWFDDEAKRDAFLAHTTADERYNAIGRPHHGDLRVRRTGAQ